MPSTALTVKIKEIKLRVFETPGVFWEECEVPSKEFQAECYS